MRFFVPALLNPHLHGLVAEQPPPKTLRTLTLLAKMLQGLANGTETTFREPFMAGMSDFLVDKCVWTACATDAHSREAFIDYVSSVCTTTDNGVTSWSSSEFELYQQPNARRLALSGAGRAVP